jgi:hypothetical protein
MHLACIIVVWCLHEMESRHECRAKVQNHHAHASPTDHANDFLHACMLPPRRPPIHTIHAVVREKSGVCICCHVCIYDAAYTYYLACVRIKTVYALLASRTYVRTVHDRPTCTDYLSTLEIGYPYISLKLRLERGKHPQ